MGWWLPVCLTFSTIRNCLFCHFVMEILFMCRAPCLCAGHPVFVEKSAILHFAKQVVAVFSYFILPSEVCCRYSTILKVHLTHSIASQMSSKDASIWVLCFPTPSAIPLADVSKLEATLLSFLTMPVSNSLDYLA